MSEPWEELVRAEQAYLSARMALFAAGAQDQLRLALASPRGRGTALRALRDVPVELVMDLVGPVFEAAADTQPEVGTAREILARVDPGWLSSILPSLVDDRLSRSDVDYADYRRVAELLSALDQEALLAEVVGRAARSDDEDIREVAEDYRTL